MAIESELRKELKRRVEAWGGEVRAVAYLGRRHCPDVLVLCGAAWFLPHGSAMVETKGAEPDARPGQLREHERLRRAGIDVRVIRNLDELNAFLPSKP